MRCTGGADEGINPNFGSVQELGLRRYQPKVASPSALVSEIIPARGVIGWLVPSSNFGMARNPDGRKGGLIYCGPWKVVPAVRNIFGD